MSDNKELTVLLTLWDRVPCTFRWMAYASKVNLPFKVLIADGGSDQSVAEVLANRTNFPNVDYEYIRYPYDATPTHYYNKVVDALNRVETPFVVLADNDDFFIVDALLRSLEFLKNHEDFSSCRGNIAGFKITPDVGLGELSNIYGRGVSFVRQIYPNEPNLEKTAVQRVHNYASNYRANWYDVFRTEQTRLSFQALRDLDTHDHALSQYVPMLLGVIAGKEQIEPYAYLFRQLEGPATCSETEIKQSDFFDRMLLDSWSTDFKGFLEIMSTAISEKDGICIEEARQQVKLGYRTLMTPGIVKCLLDSVPQPQRIRKASQLVSRMGPAGSALRRLYPLVRRIIRGESDYPRHDFIPAEELLETDHDFKLIFDFLATPPPSAIGSQHNRAKSQSGA